MPKFFDNVSGWPGYYISKKGSLYSCKNGKWSKIRGEIANGRRQFRLYRSISNPPNGKHHKWGICTTQSKWFKASRLVALAWVNNPDPEHYTIVCHIDNNPENNRWDNLYWGTQSMNIQQAVQEGRFPQCKRFGKDNPMYGVRGEDHPCWGKPCSKETRQKISLANRGRKMSEESKQKISKSLKAKNRGKTVPYIRRILRLRSKGWSQQRIANRLGLHQTAISKVLRTYNNSNKTI